jgi:hypothetical protein
MPVSNSPPQFDPIWWNPGTGKLSGSFPNFDADGSEQMLTAPQSKLMLSKALNLMTSALELLDELGAPGEIGAALDLAIAKLVKLGQEDHAPTGVQAVIAQLEHELTLDVAAGTSRPNPWKIPPA